jgi:hypothetical protein
MVIDSIHKANTPKKKILIIDDSHTHGLASEFNSNLCSEYAVTGTIMPGVKLDITNQAKRELVTLTKQDKIILWGGSKKVYKNESLAGLSGEAAGIPAGSDVMVT